MLIPLGDIRCIADEKPLTQKEHERIKRKTINELKHINYPVVIADLENKYKNASKKYKPEIMSVLITAKKQYEMMKQE